MKKTLGMMIASMRKEKGMTQLDLAEKMGVSDKAVSKWERDLSCPDINSLPKLAEIFEVSVDELMQIKLNGEKNDSKENIHEIIQTVCKAVALAMGVGVVALSVMKQLDVETGISMLGMGLACLALVQFSDKEK